MRFARYGSINPENVGILFLMAIQSDQAATLFASIAHISNYGLEEDEVLFSMHSVFRINDIQPMSENLDMFKVDLSLTTDNDQDRGKTIDGTFFVGNFSCDCVNISFSLSLSVLFVHPLNI